MSSNAIYRGDNTASFGGNFLTIKVKNPQLYKISKLLFVVNGGAIQKIFKGADYNYFQSEEITLTINYSGEETPKLSATNVLNIVAYDMDKKQYTCAQSLTFYAKNGVITRG